MREGNIWVLWPAVCHIAPQRRNLLSSQMEQEAMKTNESGLGAGINSEEHF